MRDDCKCKSNTSCGLEKGDKKVKKSGLLSSNMWALQIFFLTFALSLSFSVLSEVLLSKSNALVAFTLLAILIIINILFDIIAVAVTSCSADSFKKRLEKRERVAKLAIKMLNNAEKVNNICADVIGDICGIVSGALGAAVVLKIFSVGGANADTVIISILFSSITAALTVGGKALGKKIAITNSCEIVHNVAKVLSLFAKK